MELHTIKTDIRELISLVAKQQQINVVMTKDISGEVSMDLYQVTLEEALDAITLAGGFAYRKMDDLYYVYKPKQPRDPMSDRHRLQIFKLRYGETAKVQEALASFPNLGTVKAHEPSGSIIVQDTPENIQQIETLINIWDLAPKQVMIEAKILEVTLTDEMSFGVNWETILGDARIGTGGFSVSPAPSTGPVSPIAGTGIFGNLITGAGSRRQFAAAVDALQTKTKVDTLSTPKILAIHGEPARVQVGGQQGYRITTVADGIATESINFIDTGTILEITPFIKDGGDILLNVKPSIKSATIEAGIPVVKTTDVSTWLLAKDGQTVFIGGLIQDRNTRTRESVPCFGSIPVIGAVFGSVFHNTGKSELVVLITPQILDPSNPPQADAEMKRIESLQENLKKDLKEDLLNPARKIFQPCPEQ